MYPAVVVKTHLQVAQLPAASSATAAAILRRDVPRPLPSLLDAG